MGNFVVRIFDKRTETEITEGIGFVNMNDREHYGRKHITVLNAKGVAENVGILNNDGSVEEQPNYHIRSEIAE